MSYLFWFYYKSFHFTKSKFHKLIRLKYWSWKAKYECASYKSIYVNGPTRLTKKTFIGKNVNFNGMEIHGGGKVVIGDNFHSGKNCIFITSFHNYESTAIPYDSSVSHKSILIEDNVWLGNNVIVLGGSNIGEGAIIQAGSVVVKSIPKYAIGGGHPAKVFNSRNIENYEKLKAEGKFH